MEGRTEVRDGKGRDEEKAKTGGGALEWKEDGGIPRGKMPGALMAKSGAEGARRPS